MFLKLWEITSTEYGQALVAGIAGAVVRVVTLQERKWQAVGSIIVGAIAAIYLSPLALPFLENVLGAIKVSPESAWPLSGFLAGLGGITFATAILKIFERAGEKDSGNDSD